MKGLSKFKDKIKQINRKEKVLTEKPGKLLWGILIVILTIIFLTMFYVDNFGMFLTYYWTNHYSLQGRNLNILGSMQLPYGVLHQWICEVWVLPINFLHGLFQVSFDGIGAILWYKFCPVLFGLLCTREMGKMASSFGVKQEYCQWLQFFFLSSLLVALPVFHIAQTDTIYLWFVLKAVHSLMKEDIPGFVLWFAIAIPLKTIAIFLFVPLVFLAEKKILYILRDFIVGCVFLPIQKIIYELVNLCNQHLAGIVHAAGVDGVAEETMEEGNSGFVSHFYNKALYFEFPAVRKGLMGSTLIFILALFCIWCYMQKKEEEQQWKKLVIYVSTVALLLFFVMSSPSPYWIVILYPFLFLMIFSNYEKLRLNMVLQMVFTLTMFFVYVIDTYWVYGGSMTFDWLLLSELGIVPGNHIFQEPPHIAGYLANLGLDQFMPIVTACCLAATVGLVWVNHPKASYKEHLNEKEQLGLLHGFAWFSLLCLVGWYIMNVICLGRY